MDKEYWNEYYDNHEKPFEPSDFARAVLGYIDTDETLIDLGCGNGRDTIFFGSNGIDTIGVDQCDNIVSTLNGKRHPNVKFVADNFTNLNGEYSTTHAYSRFTLHSISELEEDSTISWVSKNINGYFFIEVRSDQDILNGKTTDHYRRFANIDKLIIKLINNGFSIKYAELSRGFSKYDKKFEVDYNEDDPMLIRIIAEATDKI